MLYPLKFKPRLKERIWGGEYFPASAKGPVGESWLLSGVRGDLSVVSEGTLKGNNIEELTEIFMGELVGDGIYNRFGIEFPLLFKIIDAKELLSVQVHPDDETARERHHSYGKTEMWYVMHAEPGAFVYIGFKPGMGQADYDQAIMDGDFDRILNKVEAVKGDAFFIPAGTVHAIGGGLRMAEIQQTSDITYRIHDWDRIDEQGGMRELHTELADSVIDYSTDLSALHIRKQAMENIPVTLVDCGYFTTSATRLSGRLTRHLDEIQSFTVFICAQGEASVKTPAGETAIREGELVLVPAEEEAVTLEGNAVILETYIK